MVTQCFNFYLSQTVLKILIIVCNTTKIYQYPKIRTHLFKVSFCNESHIVIAFYLITILTKNDGILGVLDRKFLQKTAE